MAWPLPRRNGAGGVVAQASSENRRNFSQRGVRPDHAGNVLESATVGRASSPFNGAESEVSNGAKQESASHLFGMAGSFI